MTLRSPTREGVAISLAIAVTFAGIAALVWPVQDDSPTAPAAAHVSVPARQVPVAVPDDSVTAAAIVRANIFADRRLVLPRGVTSALSVIDGPAGTESPRTRGTSDSGVTGSRGTSTPRLFGIVASPDGPAALMQLDGVGASATPYHVGDRSGSFRVVSIGDREVVVDGPGGRRTLRLFAPSSAAKSP